MVNGNYVFPAVIVLAIAGGVRQQTIVFLAPLMLFAFRKIGWKLFISAGLVGAGYMPGLVHPPDLAEWRA